MITTSPCLGLARVLGNVLHFFLLFLEIYLPAPTFIGYLKLAPSNKAVSDFVYNEDAFPFL